MLFSSLIKFSQDLFVDKGIFKLETLLCSTEFRYFLMFLAQLGDLPGRSPGFINGLNLSVISTVDLKGNADFGPFGGLISSFKNLIPCLFNSNNLPGFYGAIKTLEQLPFMSWV